LGQFATDEKLNEITTIPEFSNSIEIKGVAVTIDATGYQREIAKKIVEGGGQYVLALKENQWTLYDAVTKYITNPIENNFADITVRRHIETRKGNGREEKMQPTALPEKYDSAATSDIQRSVVSGQQNEFTIELD